MSSDPAPPPLKRVMIVEDDADFFVLMRMMLEGQPLEVRHYREGRPALESVCEFQPDLLVLDLNLPDMSGWEVLTAMRDTTPCAEVPVIILSSQGTRVDRHFGLQVARVHSYLIKPCLPSQFRAAIAEALGIKLD